ncbi:MAG TPA: tetratricopeptide repeat protein, partial [Bacteroidota bacterium]
ILADDSARTPRQTLQDAFMELGEAELLNNDAEKSLSYFDRAGRVGGTRSGEAWFRAGEMAERTGKAKAMADFYGRAVDDTTTAIDRRMVLIGGIKGATGTKDYLGAVRLAAEYRTKYPTDENLPRILFESAVICADNLRDYRQAINFDNEILAKFPLSPYVDDALYGMGMALYRAGEFDESIRTLESLAKRFPSSSLVDSAETEAQYIRLFELKNKESGLEKLALLVGDVIAQESKGDLAYRLADIYFHELKDYRQAAVQYRAALNAGLEEGLRPAAWYNLARSYQFLNLQDRMLGKQQSATADAVSAIAAYDSVLTNYLGTEYTDDAAMSQLALRVQLAKTPSDLRTLGSKLLGNVSRTRFKDRALLVVANAYLQGKDLEDAALTYKAILDQGQKGDSESEARFQYGKTLLGLADLDSGAVLLKSFLETNPNHQRSAEAASLLAQYESAAGRAAIANGYFDLLEKKFYYTDYAADLGRKRGDAYFNAGDFARASVLYTGQIRKDRSDFFVYDDVSPDLLYRTGYAFEKLGNAAEARRYYTEYITRVKKSDKLGQVYYSLATIARSENNSELAGKYLQESIQYAPASSEEATALSLEAADLLFGDEQYADAITRYNEVARLTKNDSVQQVVQTRTIVCYFRLDNIKEAEKRSALFIKAYPNNEESAAEFEFERGRYFLRKDDSGKALARFEAVTRRYAGSQYVPEALFWTGRAYELAEKPQLAISHYDSVVKHYPGSDVAPRAELSLGNIYYNQEQWDPAVRYYKEVVDSASRAPDIAKYAMNNLAMAYKQLKLYDAAMELDRKYIELYPNDDDIIDKKIDIAVLYQNLGYYDQSIVQLQSLLDLGNPSIEAELRYYIGEANFYKGNYQQAILDFLKVPYLVTRRGKADWISTSYYMAGQSYEKMSKFDLALAMYKKIIESKETDTQFKSAAQREIDRVQSLIVK